MCIDKNVSFNLYKSQNFKFKCVNLPIHTYVRCWRNTAPFQTLKSFKTGHLVSMILTRHWSAVLSPFCKEWSFPTQGNSYHVARLFFSLKQANNKQHHRKSVAVACVVVALNSRAQLCSSLTVAVCLPPCRGNRFKVVAPPTYCWNALSALFRRNQNSTTTSVGFVWLICLFMGAHKPFSLGCLQWFFYTKLYICISKKALAQR